jgi:hypothetical protein
MVDWVSLIFSVLAILFWFVKLSVEVANALEKNCSRSSNTDSIALNANLTRLRLADSPIRYLEPALLNAEQSNPEKSLLAPSSTSAEASSLASRESFLSFWRS